jgi:diadenosine tetraphosphate (Ap4A) HIT family hydrolase
MAGEESGCWLKLLANEEGVLMVAEYRTEKDSDCLFCRWIKEGRQVDALGTVAAFTDGFPVTQGHLLIVSLRHAEDWLSLNEQELRDSDALIQKLIKKIQQDDPTVTGFNIGLNIGASAGQTIFHSHIHLIPRRDNDTDFPKGGVRGVIKGKRSYPVNTEATNDP